LIALVIFGEAHFMKYHISCSTKWDNDTQ